MTEHLRIFSSGTPTDYTPRAWLRLEDIEAMSLEQVIETFPGAKAAFQQLGDWTMSDEMQKRESA